MIMITIWHAIQQLHTKYIVKDTLIDVMANRPTLTRVAVMITFGAINP